MDQDINGAKFRMHSDAPSNITQVAYEAYKERELGFRSKSTCVVSPVLKACAEDELVKKEYKEMRCDIPGLTKSTFLMVFSPDGTKMASTHGNHNVYVTDLRTGKNIKTLSGHPRTPWCVAFHPSSNQILASGCLGGQVRIWDLSGGSEVWTAENQTVISSLAFHPVERLLVIATFNELYFWDWSQSKPFMQTCTNNQKEKVRYVAFDRLGHKLITGIANTLPAFSRWERVRAPVPVARHTERIAAYRRRITPRLLPHGTGPPSGMVSTLPDVGPILSSSIPEREQRIAVCYRNLVEQYEMLVHRYLEIYRPATTIDRGTDPMEAEHLTSNSTSAPIFSPPIVINGITVPPPPPPPILSSTLLSQPSTSSATLPPPTSIPGPSGLARPSTSAASSSSSTRPAKRSNVPKSDSSTVYQSDSSSSSSSDESPTPKRRISLVQSSNLLRRFQAVGAGCPKNKKKRAEGVKVRSKQELTKNKDGRKRVLVFRPAKFHVPRSQSFPINPRNFITRDNPHKLNLNLILGRGEHGYGDTAGTNTTETLYVPPQNNEATTNEQPTNEQQPNVERPPPPPPNREIPPCIGICTNLDRPNSRGRAFICNCDCKHNRNASAPDLPFSLIRLRCISEVTLPADEVINFSERTDTETPDAELPTDAEVSESVDGIYTHLLDELETNLREARITTRASRNSDLSNTLSSFSERLENIMNQSDAILTNLRRSMEMLMEPSSVANNTSNTPPTQLSQTSSSQSTTQSSSQSTTQSSSQSTTTTQPSSQSSTTTQPSSQPGPSTSTDNSSGGRIFILRKPPGFPAHNRTLPRNAQSRNPQGGSSSDFQMRANRYFRIRQPGLGVRPRSVGGVWRPFDDHSYPRDPDQNNPDRPSNIEPITSLLTLSPRSPTGGDDNTSSTTVPPLVSAVLEEQRSSTPVPFTTTDSYTEPSQSTAPPDNPITDHTYPRDPQNTTPEYIAPLVTSLHSTISHISMQTNLLRRQVENIEIVDRARYEVNQLHELHRMWQDSRARLDRIPIGTERRSNMTNVRQMMAWTRISDPSSDSPQSSTEQSGEPADRPTPSTSRSSSSNEARTPTPYLSRFRHIKKKMYWRRRPTKDLPPFVQRRYVKAVPHREQRPTRADPPGAGRSNDFTLSEAAVGVMIRALEHLLTQQSRSLGRRDVPSLPTRNNLEYRIQSERIIQQRIRAAQVRLNRIVNTVRATRINRNSDYAYLANRNDFVRYEARLRLSVYIETVSRFIESHKRKVLPKALSDQIKILLDLASLVTDVTLLQVMNTTPLLSGSSNDSDRENLARRVSQMCTSILQNNTGNPVRTPSLIRILNDLRLSARNNPGIIRQFRSRYNNERPTDTNPSRVSPREAMIDLNRQLRRLYQFTNYLNDSESFSPPPPAPTVDSNSSTNVESTMSHVYRLGDLLARLRNVRGRLEQVSQNVGTRIPNSSSTTEPEPTTRSTDDSPSDRDEPFEGFPSQWDQPIPDQGNLYRSQHINLYPPDPPSSSQSSPERVVTERIVPPNRPWNVPTVHVNDVPVNEMVNQPRIWLSRYPAELRPLSAATGLFRPRFLIPLYSGANPFEPYVDDQREGPSVSYDGIMTTTASPNHRIQMWDISKCAIPDISNHEKNIVVSECKIHNDGSVDISSDGTLLVTLLPSGGYMNVTNRLGIYSIKWDTLGQCLYTTSFEQNAISVSLSPLSRHLIVGLASRRVTLLPTDRWTMARVFLLDDSNIKVMGRGQLVVLRDLEQGRERDLNFVSVNCIKWMPVSGQGIVYATNTGQLKVLT